MREADTAQPFLQIVRVQHETCRANKQPSSLPVATRLRSVHVGLAASNPSMRPVTYVAEKQDNVSTDCDISANTGLSTMYCPGTLLLLW